MAKGAGKARKKLPKELAVIRADNRTGCEACIEVCPVDCIYKVPGEISQFCKPSAISTLSAASAAPCASAGVPGDGIDMVLTPTIAEHVANKGGPPQYVEKNFDRLVARPRPWSSWRPNSKKNETRGTLMDDKNLRAYMAELPGYVRLCFRERRQRCLDKPPERTGHARWSWRLRWVCVCLRAGHHAPHCLRLSEPFRHADAVGFKRLSGLKATGMICSRFLGRCSPDSCSTWSCRRRYPALRQQNRHAVFESGCVWRRWSDRGSGGEGDRHRAGADLRARAGNFRFAI